MVEVPEHFPLPVNNQAQGPEEDFEAIHYWVCWCVDPQCPRFQVSGNEYREAVRRLESHRVSRQNAEMVVQQLIILGWTRTGEAVDG